MWLDGHGVAVDMAFDRPLSCRPQKDVQIGVLPEPALLLDRLLAHRLGLYIAQCPWARPESFTGFNREE